MKKTRLTKSLSLILCMVLIAAMTLFTTGCSDTKDDNKETATSTSDAGETTGADESDSNVLGEGEYSLYVKTVNGITVDYDKDGKYWAFYIDGEYAMTGVDATDIEEGASYTFKVE